MKIFHLLRLCAIVLSLFYFIGCRNHGPAAQSHVTVPSQLLSFTPVFTDKDEFHPVHITNANDSSGRLFITDITGRVMIYKNGEMLKKPFLDMRHYLQKGDMRLISVAFRPDFSQSGVFFVFYTDLLGKIYITRFLASKAYPDTAMIESAKVVYTAESRTGRVHHHGGDMHFGRDGYLYAAVGYMDKQGDPSRQAQNMRLPFGKILRFDVSMDTPPFYKIPPDNPFINRHDTLPEIWASGLRNPWRFCFDKATGDFWEGDVGQDKYEEINFRRFGDSAGANFGWDCYEADSSYKPANCKPNSTYTFPVFWYEHNYKTGNSITGGVVYRGSAYPSLYGYYICADFDSDEAWLIKQNSDSFEVRHQKTEVPTSIVGFGEDEKGEMYAARYTGIIYKVSAAGADSLSKQQTDNVSKK